MYYNCNYSFLNNARCTVRLPLISLRNLYDEFEHSTLITSAYHKLRETDGNMISESLGNSDSISPPRTLNIPITVIAEGLRRCCGSMERSVPVLADCSYSAS